MGKVTQALKDKEEAKRLRSTANIIDVSDVPDPLLAEFMRYDATQLEASSEQSLNPHHSSLAGAGGELVPDGDQLKAGMNFIDTIKHPDAVTAEASFERLRLTDEGIDSAALAVDTAESIQASNSIEKMMAHQMAAAHKLAMIFAGKSKGLIEHQGSAWGEDEAPYAAEAAQVANASARMMDTFQKAALALHKLRVGGRQTVTVQHVNVNDGGQAVVTGGINGGGKHEK